MEANNALRLIGFLTTLLGCCINAGGQEKQPIEYSVEVYEQLRQELLKPANRAKLPIPEDQAKQGLFVAHEGTYIGRNFFGSSGRSFLVCVLRVANLTEEPFKLEMSTISLNIDGRNVAHTEWPKRLSTSQIRIGSRRLASIKTPEKIALESGQVQEVVATFMSLPEANPGARLVVTVGGLPQPVQFDLFKIAVRDLALKTERAGPRDCLGVLTVEGSIDSVNAWHLVSEMGRLSAAGSNRILVQWHPNSPRVLDTVRRWLTQSAASIGRATRSTNGFPPLPLGITELHLGPFGGSTRENRYVTNSFIYGTREEAFISAIGTAYSRLPLPELIRDTKHDDPLVRAAAIRSGAGRLPADIAPTLIEHLRGDNKHLRRAAIVALAALPSEEAVQTVAQHVASDDELLSAKAVRGLRDSRFPIARQALANALKDAEDEKRDKIARVLMSDVRPEWKELYYEYASHGGNDLARRAVQALRKTGHPKLNTLLKQLLSDTSPSIRTEAFQELSTSRDPAARSIARAYTLEYIEKTVPRQDMLVLIERLGAREAIPALQKHYETEKGNRQFALLRTIMRISDESTVPFLLQCYKQASGASDAPRRSEILRTLQGLRFGGIMQLAEESLESNNSALLQAACKILEDDASDESVRRIGQRLVGLDNSQNRDMLANALLRSLSLIGSPEARRYLRIVANGESESRRRTSKRVLENLHRYSPAAELQIEASRLVDMAKAATGADGKPLTEEQRRKTIASAERVYARALESDPWCPEIYISRGHMKTHDNRRAEGIKDFDKALELDPFHPIATSLKAIGVVVLGDAEGGLKTIEDNRERFKWDSIFIYNAACAYGQAIQTTPASADNLEQLAGWRKRALDHLSHCVNAVPFPGLADMDTDPDLKPLYNLPRFKELMKQLKPTEPADEEDDG